MGRGKRWSSEDIEYLYSNWGSKSIDTIAKVLDRTEDAIRIKTYELKLGSLTKAGDLILLHELIDALGFESSYEWMKNKFIKNGLPVKKKRIKKKCVLKISIDDFWKWAEKNKSILNFSKFEENLLGKEPKWVKEKRVTDRLNPCKATPNRIWTKEADELLIQRIKTYRYTYKDLAEEFDRTEHSIRQRLKVLGLKYRPIRLTPTQYYWTDEEKEKLKELHEKGYDNYAIAKMLNRSQFSISNKIKAIG